MNEQRKRQLQAVMSDPRWTAVEEFVRHFMEEHFIAASIKRDTEFNTIWYAAEAEGGKNYIKLLFAEMEKAAEEALG
jgi:hypothetical protein